jgi:hypothetical protein
LFSYRWNRKESRLDALSAVLRPVIRAGQHLHEANALRRQREQLIRSFPDPQKSPEAVVRLDRMMTKYSELIQAAHDDFRDAEADLAARSFRFPDKVLRLLVTAKDSLSEFGRLVNEGLFEKADLQFAKFKDDYSQTTRIGRGWRIAGPFERVRKCWRRNPDGDTPPNRFELTPTEVDSILELVHKRATTQANNTFAIHPPKKLLGQPTIATSDNVVEELESSIFVVAFQDGTARMMSFVELMFFMYNLV